MMPRKNIPLTGDPTQVETDPAPPDVVDAWDEIPIDVYERRLLEPDTERSEPITLRTEGRWYLRWINTELTGRWAHVVHRMGYIPVKATELIDPRAVTGMMVSPEGIVCRGDRGREVLVRMPLEWWEKIQKAKADRRQRQSNDGARVREELQQAVAGRYGDEAADTVGGWKGTIVTGRERIDD